jgi:hypothetical protein
MIRYDRVFTPMDEDVPVYEVPEMTRLSVTALLSLSVFLAACAGGALGRSSRRRLGAGDRWVLPR